MIKNNDIKTTSKYKMILASFLGAPFKSELLKRPIASTFLLIQKAATATKTSTAKISNEPIRKP